MSVNAGRIGVMMGGCSSEREISLKSGRAVVGALQEGGFDVIALDVTSETQEEVRRLIRENMVDVVFVAMHGGFGEDGRLQDILEKIPVRYTGPGTRASRMAMDKIVSRRCFAQAGLHVPRSVVAKKGRRYPFMTRWLRAPFVVKPSAQGSSIGISFVADRRDLPRAITEAHRYGEDVLVEEFIRGRELTVAIVNDRPLPVVEIRPKRGFFDFEAKYHKGLTDYIVPAPLDSSLAARIQADALKAYRVLGCRHLSRVDVILKDEKTPYILEVNTIPGMTETSLLPKAAAAAGMNFVQLCRSLVEMACAQAFEPATVSC
ncbi:MAG: D-alanine--D-alanine ligase [Candidatus Omnitrophota bacterium]|nr:D-alanine--D-alanine ligase [Candidatus Omnitrophota bacterium]MDD5137237.1 D-alanine--D-alanine ligase [Candidatus Omnitrophota bacterium]MDD5537924.1 D-alanine--D-alanine ligase [Candidatus Omnitrophota bacterium]